MATQPPSRLRAPNLLPALVVPAVFLLVAALIATAGYYRYEDLKKSIRDDSYANLTAIADHKAAQIAQWMKQRRNEAEAIGLDRFLAKELRNGVTRDLRAYMDKLTQQGGYQATVLLDTRGNVILSMGDEVRSLDPEIDNLVTEAVKCSCVQVSDLRVEAGTGIDGLPPKIHMDLLTPLKYVSSGKERIVGAMLLRIDPHTAFYPLVQSWPTASKTAETQLVRAEGQDVLFLNPLRHQRDAAFTLRMPLGSADLPAAMVARGWRGVVEGVDYRGEPVVAALRKIPATPWTMVVKMDTAELFAPLARSGRTILSGTLLLVLLTAAAFFMFWLQQRAVEHQKQEALAERAALGQKLESFIQSISQELRTPLSDVEKYARQLQDALPDGFKAQSRNALERIRAGLQAMDRRIDDLHAFSRLSSRDLTPERIDMAGLFRAVFDELRAAEPGREVRLELGTLPTAQGDPLMIREVVKHLLTNAFKFTRPRKPARIEVGALETYMGHAGYRTFFVKDNGVGFDMQQAGRLFAVFQRLHDPKAFEGSGMGLAVVKQIVERHGGQAWVQASPDEGALFFFSLPSQER